MGRFCFTDSTEAMTFLQGQFWAFLAAVLLCIWGIERAYGDGRKGILARNAFLAAVSLYFYYMTSGWFVSLLLGTTLSDWAIARRIAPAEGRKRKAWLATSLAINLGILGTFKYAYFFADNLSAWSDLVGGGFSTAAHAFRDSIADRIALPVGISFYTFQTLSYSIDVYRKELEPVRNPLDFAFYVSFFPQLVAGPIVRAKEFMPQVLAPAQVTRLGYGLGIFWILNGLLKKVWVADFLATRFVDGVFLSPESFTGIEVLFALYAYSLQVYADFSGYTDMAIGIALLIGFRLPQNFNSPYKAANPAEFWRRWHMSLSTWLRDYVYIPMGGNRGLTRGTWVAAGITAAFVVFMLPAGVARWAAVGALGAGALVVAAVPGVRKAATTNAHMMLTMLVGGLWHGASWNFVLWGGMNGLGLAVWKGLSGLYERLRLPTHTWIWRAAGIAATFHFITFTRIWFRSGSKTTWDSIGTTHDLSHEWSTAATVLERLGAVADPAPYAELLHGYRDVLLVLAVGFAVHFLPETWKTTYRHHFARAPWPVHVVAVLLSIGLAWNAMAHGLQPFIYFQF